MSTEIIFPNIVAIGGGSVGEGATASLDKIIFDLARKPNPYLVFLPTASSDSRDYEKQVFKAYEPFGCKCETIYLLDADLDLPAAIHKIAKADIVYVGGGNTKMMVEIWKRLGVDAALEEHIESGKPVGGVSAGAICWFTTANSDWPQYEGIPDITTAPVKGLGFVDLTVCPHTLREPFRLGDFREMMREIPGPGVGIDDCCALQICGKDYRIQASLEGSKAHLIEWKNGILHERDLEPHDDFRLLTSLALP